MDTYQMKLGGLTLETASEAAKPLLEGAQRQMGMIPNMYARMAQMPGLLDTYLHGYGLFRSQSGFTPVEQEVVLLTVSRENSCAYCMAAHSMVGKTMSKVPQDVLDAVRSGEPIADLRLQALSAFTEIMLRKRGNPSAEDVTPFLNAGYTEHHVLAVILAISVKIISNYSNHLFHTPVDAPFAPFAWQESEHVACVEEAACR